MLDDRQMVVTLGKQCTLFNVIPDWLETLILSSMQTRYASSHWPNMGVAVWSLISISNNVYRKETTTPDRDCSNTCSLGVNVKWLHVLFVLLRLELIRIFFIWNLYCICSRFFLLMKCNSLLIGERWYLLSRRRWWRWHIVEWDTGKKVNTLWSATSWNNKPCKLEVTFIHVNHICLNTHQLY